MNQPAHATMRQQNKKVFARRMAMASFAQLFVDRAIRTRQFRPFHGSAVGILF
jgi:hypothetical protein